MFLLWDKEKREDPDAAIEFASAGVGLFFSRRMSLPIVHCGCVLAWAVRILAPLHSLPFEMDVFPNDGHNTGSEKSVKIKLDANCCCC